MNLKLVKSSERCLYESYVGCVKKSGNSNCKHNYIRKWVEKKIDAKVTQKTEEILEVSLEKIWINKSKQISWFQKLIKFHFFFQTSLISLDALFKVIDPSQLTLDLEGSLHYDHAIWIEMRCVSIIYTAFVLIFFSRVTYIFFFYDFAAIRKKWKCVSRTREQKRLFHFWPRSTQRLAQNLWLTQKLMQIKKLMFFKRD